MNRKQFGIIYVLLFGMFLGSSITVIVGNFIDPIMIFGVMVVMMLFLQMYQMKYQPHPKRNR